MVTAAFGHWLAGFIDGEGCFYFWKYKNQRCHLRQISCRFRLKLRDDDRAILAEIVATTSIGAVRRERNRRAGGRSYAVWEVDTKAGCSAMVELLDRFPLRAKKRNDYSIWKSAVALWVTGERDAGRGRPQDRKKWSKHEMALKAARLYNDFSATKRQA